MAALINSANLAMDKRQQLQLVTDAELRDHGVNGADLQPGMTTSIAQLCSVDVILPVRSQER